jgi:dihydroorotate dehydrogenase electron transfer subunit
VSFVDLSILPAPAEPTDPGLEWAEVLANEPIADEHFRLRVRAPLLAERCWPGQFANLTVARAGEWAPVLPRPMAVYGWDVARGEAVFVYRVIGEGTRLLSLWRPGESLVTVGPLGRGFELLPGTRGALLIGRGIGVCSLTALVEQAAARGIALHALASARRPEFILGLDLFERLGAGVTAVHDLDGSSAVEQLRPRLERVLDRMPVGQIFVCGSNRLLELAADFGRRYRLDVQVSLEARMACGLGYCHGCSTGYPGLAHEAPLVCKDGPVFAARATSGAGLR